MDISSVLKDHGIGGGGALKGDAVATDVLSGKTFSNANGNKNTGTMPNNGAVTITPSTVNQTIAQGYHNGSGVVVGDADLIPSNIKDGVNIFGVVGNQMFTGKKWASGNVTADGSNNFTVTGLAFAPANIVVTSGTMGCFYSGGTSFPFITTNAGIWDANKKITSVTASGFSGTAPGGGQYSWIAFE